jgi:hypothetical protein
MIVLAVLPVAAQSAAIRRALITPDKLESSIGTLEFKDGARSKETAAKIYDNLHSMHGCRGVRRGAHRIARRHLNCERQAVQSRRANEKEYYRSGGNRIGCGDGL